MTANSSTIGNNEIARSDDAFVNFSPEVMKAPFFLRLGAAFIDYILIVIFPVLGLLISSSSGNDGSRLIHSEFNDVGWLVAMFVAIVNLIILQAAIGQSVGKLLTGIRIVDIDGSEASFGSIIFRNTLGYALTLGSAGLGLLVSLFSSKGRALQDYIAGTVVIYARRKIVNQSHQN